MKIKKSAGKSALTPNVKTSISIATASAAEPETVIEVKHNVGFGNAIFLRGQGGGLNWESGVPLVCVDATTWRWTGKLKGALTFKTLLNDEIWSSGNDMTVKPGQKVQIQPRFL